MRWQKTHMCKPKNFSAATCHARADQHEWVSAAGNNATAGRGSILRVTRERWCEVMAQQRIRRVAIVGDSIAWSMVQSLWKLLDLPEHGPPARKPESKLLSIPCAAATGHGAAHRKNRLSAAWHSFLWGGSSNASSSVELHWVLSNHLNTSLTLEAMRTADVTLLNAGPWYSPSNAPLRARVPGQKTVSSGKAWSVFADDLLELQTGLRKRGLPNDSHRLIWRTSHTGHPQCDKHHRPFSTPGEALDGLNRCTRCVEDWGWQWMPTYDHSATNVLGSLGAQVFDIRPMTTMRPDAHSEKRFGGQPDCLHLALPGVPDWWNALLLSSIETCGG